MREPFHKFIEQNLTSGTLLIACGLPASWKTETTEEVQKIKGWRILRTDLIRLKVLEGMDIFDEKVASNMELRKKVYDEMFRLAGEALETEDNVILDATFVTKELRGRAAEVAAAKGKTFVILQTKCTKETSLKRIMRRTKENYESNALTEQAYTNNLKKFQEPAVAEFKEVHPDLAVVHLLVDTEQDESENWYIIGMEMG